MLVYIGIDWSTQKHAVLFMNEKGGVVQYLEIQHSLEGFCQLDLARQALRIHPADCVVGLETAHTLLIDFLWVRQYTQVYVLHPNIVKSAQGRYRQSGAKDDRQDAQVIANLLRTDLHRFIPWQPDDRLTSQIRIQISLVRFLTRQAISVNNRLWAVLSRYYPAGLSVFSELNNLISLAFLQAFPSPQAAARLSYAEFTAFLQAHHHRRPAAWPLCYARLRHPQPEAHPDLIPVYASQTQLLAAHLERLIRSKNQLLQQVHQLFEQHPDAPIYAHLPGTGILLQPALLAKLGADRRRFPSSASLQQLAGTCPITRRSGKTRIVMFRRTCDREFRYIAQEWSRASITRSPWAAAYYHHIRPTCRSDNHAFRCLANRWLAVLWRLWQDHLPYDQEFHLQNHFRRSQPISLTLPLSV